MVREDVIVRLRERIVAFAASRISRDVAEDLAQEVLIVLQEKYAHVTEIQELIPLSLQIVRFKMVSLRRKLMRRGENTSVSVDELPLPDLGQSPLTALERKERVERLKAALATLGERCRQLMRLKLEGKAFAEIQKEMGAATINTVYTWDFRCRKELLERLGGGWEGKP